jgi:cell division protein FtsB
MRAAKYLFALWAGILVYTSLSVLFGSMGISAQRQLEREKEKQEANIESLEMIRLGLIETRNSLLYDSDTLTVYAREQGYAMEGERFARIVGLGANQANRTQAGTVVVAAGPQYAPDKTLRIIALCMGIAIFICILTFDVLKYFRER